MERQELINHAMGFFGKNPLVTLITQIDGYPNARPVGEPRIHDGNILIITSASSRKVQQLKDDPHMAVHAYSPKSMSYCTVRGLAEITNDKALRDQYWKDDLTRYFPKGVDDPEYCFVKLDIRGVDFVDYSEGFDKPIIHRESW